MGKQVGQAVRRPHECSNYFGIGYRELERTVNRPVELLDDLVVLIDLGYVLLKMLLALLGQVDNIPPFPDAPKDLPLGGFGLSRLGFCYHLLHDVGVSGHLFHAVYL